MCLDVHRLLCCFNVLLLQPLFGFGEKADSSQVFQGYNLFNTGDLSALPSINAEDFEPYASVDVYGDQQNEGEWVQNDNKLALVQSPGQTASLQAQHKQQDPHHQVQNVSLQQTGESCIL